jgi:hypothetical protein
MTRRRLEHDTTTSESIRCSASVAPRHSSTGRYLVVTGYDGQVSQTIMTREEKAKLTRDGIDFDYDRASCDMLIRLATGQIKHFQGRCPFGSETYSLLEKILMATSDYVSLVSEDWQYAQVSRMRAVFGDPPGQDHFFEVQRYPEYCIRVRPEIRWRIITVWQANDS